MNKFTRDQLEAVVSSIFRAAVDQFQSSTPPTISQAEYDARQDLIGEYLLGVHNTLGTTISVFYATVTGEGLAVGDFPQFIQFGETCHAFMSYSGENREFPDVQPLVPALVTHLFAEYLGEKVQPNELEDEDKRRELCEKAIGEYEFNLTVEHRGQWEIAHGNGSKDGYVAYNARVYYEGGGTDVFSVRFKPGTNTVISAETLY